VEFDLKKAKAHSFVSKHVLTHLDSADFWKPRRQIAEEIKEFVGDDPEFWADYASYDWVALCQLFGTMMDLPKGWPMFVRDIQQLRKFLVVSKFDVFHAGEHDALKDALEVKGRFDVLAYIQAHKCGLAEALEFVRSS
jgi:3' exoribonuclease, RNase T-like